MSVCVCVSVGVKYFCTPLLFGFDNCILRKRKERKRRHEKNMRDHKIKKNLKPWQSINRVNGGSQKKVIRR